MYMFAYRQEVLRGRKNSYLLLKYCSSQHRHIFVPRPASVGFVVDQVALGQVFQYRCLLSVSVSQRSIHQSSEDRAMRVPKAALPRDVGMKR